MMDLGHALKWIVENWASISTIGGVLVSIGYKVHKTWPDLPQNAPRLEALQEFGSALMPDIQKAAPALYKLLFGKSPPPPAPPLPPLTMLLVMALALTGCPKPLPQFAGCTPHDMECRDGVPMVCSPSQRWVPSSRACNEIGAVCCATGSFHTGRPIITCTRPEFCIDRDGGSHE